MKIIGKKIEEKDQLTNYSALSQELYSCQEYLKDTDWYIIRNADTGESVPDEIKTLRQTNRERINVIRSQLGESANLLKDWTTNVIQSELLNLFPKETN